MLCEQTGESWQLSKRSYGMITRQDGEYIVLSLNELELPARSRKPRLLRATRRVCASRTPESHLQASGSNFPAGVILEVSRGEVSQRTNEYR